MNKPHLPTRRPAGLTLIELMIVLAVASILSGIGLPYLGSVIESTRMRAIANDFHSSLHLARSESIKSNTRVALCKSPGGTSCVDTGGWEQGWIVFQDTNNNRLADEGEAVIRATQALPQGYRLVGNTSVASYISFAPTGGTRLASGAFQAGTLILCKQDGRSREGREIVINNIGRTRVNKTASAACE